MIHYRGLFYCEEKLPLQSHYLSRVCLIQVLTETRVSRSGVSWTGVSQTGVSRSGVSPDLKPGWSEESSTKLWIYQTQPWWRPLVNATCWTPYYVIFNCTGQISNLFYTLGYKKYCLKQCCLSFFKYIFVHQPVVLDHCQDHFSTQI